MVSKSHRSHKIQFLNGFPTISPIKSHTNFIYNPSVGELVYPIGPSYCWMVKQLFNPIKQLLVGGLEHVLFHILGTIIPTD